MERSVKSVNPNMTSGDEESCYSRSAASPPSCANFLTAEEESDIKERLENYKNKLQKG